MIPLSVLDLSPVPQGQTPADALRHTLDLARHAEAWGYQRYWLAEHHNMPGIASAATAVVLAAVGSVTTTLRIGAGGVMLPNHSPLVIAEQFGTLASLYGDRIDLGLGRAPGTDQHTAQALRRDLLATSERFPQDVQELLGYFEPASPGQRIRAVPGAGLRVPVWILGSSLFGAQLAAALGLPYAFASHFAPDLMLDALAQYRTRFQPSRYLQKPYAMLGLNVVAAETDDQARYHFTSLQQAFVRLRRGMPGLLPPPERGVEASFAPYEKAMIDRALACAIVGSADTVRAGLRAFVQQTGADELMVTGQIHSHEARLRSFQILAEVARE